jgi:hypothetical protein
LKKAKKLRKWKKGLKGSAVVLKAQRRHSRSMRKGQKRGRGRRGRGRACDSSDEFYMCREFGA